MKSSLDKVLFFSFLLLFLLRTSNLYAHFKEKKEYTRTHQLAQKYFYNGLILAWVSAHFLQNDPPVGISCAIGAVVTLISEIVYQSESYYYLYYEED